MQASLAPHLPQASNPHPQPPASVTSPPKVPLCWALGWNPQDHQWYYINALTGASQWEPPSSPAVPSTVQAATETDQQQTKDASPQKYYQEDEDLAKRLQAEEYDRHGSGPAPTGHEQTPVPGQQAGPPPPYAPQPSNDVARIPDQAPSHSTAPAPAPRAAPTLNQAALPPQPPPSNPLTNIVNGAAAKLPSLLNADGVPTNAPPPGHPHVPQQNPAAASTNTAAQAGQLASIGMGLLGHRRRRRGYGMGGCGGGGMPGPYMMLGGHSDSGSELSSFGGSDDGGGGWMFDDSGDFGGGE